MSATATRSVDRVMLTRRFAEHVEDLEGNVVEVWDFFQRGESRRAGAAALAARDVQQDDPSS
jgi:hypothetical protein